MKYLLIIIFTLCLSTVAYANELLGDVVPEGICAPFFKLTLNISPSSGDINQQIDIQGRFVLDPKAPSECLTKEARTFLVYLGIASRINDGLVGGKLDTRVGDLQENVELDASGVAFILTKKITVKDLAELGDVDLKNGDDLFIRLSAVDTQLGRAFERISSTVAYNIRISGEFGANKVCAVKDLVSGAYVCPIKDGKALDANDKNFSDKCKVGEACDACDLKYIDTECTEGSADTEPGCYLIESKDCANLNRQNYWCSSKDNACHPESEVDVKDRVGTMQNNPTCSNTCSRSSTSVGNSGGYIAPPSQPIAFSIKIPNLLAGKAENLRELVDYVLSNVLKFVIPLATIFIVLQGVKLLVNPIMGLLGRSEFSTKEVYEGIAMILIGLAVIFIGRGFVTLILSLLGGLKQ